MDVGKDNCDVKRIRLHLLFTYYFYSETLTSLFFFSLFLYV